MFIDEAEIFVSGGRGGHGCLSFRREKFIPKGGPDGGNGGDGGNVVLVASPGVDTLMDFKGKHHWRAPNGQPGLGKNMAGACGEDLIVRLPPGTLVYDRDSGLLMKDLAELGDSVCVAKGGKGGKGNKSFARPTHQTPREFEPGEEAEERHLKLELKLIAEVGIVGLPNAGKSTLLSRLSAARPKVADYPFTTLAPQLGIVELSGFRRFVMADMPGLIEGAHEGVGLGDTFLRHIERTRVLLHLIDIAPADAQPSPADAYRVVREEIRRYSESLAEKPELIAVNKMDLVPDDAEVRRLSAEIGREVIPISAATGRNLPALCEALWRHVVSGREAAAASAAEPAVSRP